MVQILSLAQAIGLVTILPLAVGRAVGQAPVRRGYEELRAMLSGSQPVELNPGWPWEGGYEQFFDYGANTADCVADMPTGLGPTTSPDTAAAFLNNTVYSTNAKNLGVTNSTYNVVTINTQGSVIPTARDPEPIGYQGWINMPSYVPYDCSLLCNKIGPGNCSSYNIYYLRSPTEAPAAACPQPSSMTNIVCGFYANFTNYWNMVNVGQNRTQFQVVIAGSNNYNRVNGTF